MIKENKVLVFMDVHCPYQDQRALDLVYKAGKEFKPDTIVIIGDFIDNYCISRYEKDPAREKALKKEIEVANRELDKIDDLFPKAKKIFMMGNHEQRLEDYIKKEAPELFGLMSSASLLKLKERGYIWYPYGKHHKIGKLIFTHGNIASKHTASSMLDKYEHSVCFGHVHKIEEAIKVNALGEAHVAFTAGWLGDKTKADYIKSFANWQLGFATVRVLQNGNFFHQIHPIIGYKCLMNGKIYEG